MVSMSQQNQALQNENVGLKGSMDDKQKHFEGLNEQLTIKNEQNQLEIQSLTDSTDQLREKMGNINNDLNIKTQQSMML